VYDDTGGIGKLYARQDEIGTPFCVTVDHESLEDNAVTVRDRDTWEQERVNVDVLAEFISSRLK
jgi:glycyl-tRNA synthetase